MRHSDPASEVEETKAKAGGLLAALRHEQGLGAHPEVHRALAERNRHLAGFWLSPRERRTQPDPGLAGLRVLVVDAEDTFTEMIANHLDALGLTGDERVLEVGYDHMEGTRFRHTAQFKRWRPDREPSSCTYGQLDEPVSYDLGALLPGAPGTT